MIKCNISTSKKARYFLSQHPHSEIDQVWIVLHGYGQLANSFLNWFKPVFSKNILIISPEGLHRFYWKGFNGKVAAAWMTKEDRVDDINDYINYLDNLIDQIKPQLSKKIFYHLLGFSQGAATACRWVNAGNTKFNSLTLWAGSFPEDIDCINKMNIFNTLNTKIFIGDNDEFYNEKIIEKEIKKLNDHKMNFKIQRYKGIHKIENLPLIKLKELIEKEIASSKQLKN